MYDRIVRIKRSRLYFVETAIGLIILLAINMIFFPDRPAYQGIYPNPYWLIIIAIAGRYGRMGGIISSVSASTIFCLHYLFVKGPDIFYEDPWILRFPFLFMLMGFLIGEIKTVFILREDYLTSRVEELMGFNDQLRKEISIIKEAHKGLSVDVATTTDTITILNEITSRLKSNDPAEIYHGILESFQEHLEVEECSFYELQGNKLILEEAIGWKDYHRRPTSLAVGEGLIGLAAQMMSPMSIKDIVLKKQTDTAEQAGLLGDTVLAVPVIGIENNLYGVASIERLPLFKLTETTIQTAKIMCEIAASALNIALSVHSLEEKQIHEKEYDLFKYHYFLSRVEEEFNRSRNYMLPLSLMVFKWSKLGELDDEKKRPLLESLIKLIKTNLRTFDVLAQGPSEKMPLVLLLATTSGPQANGVKEKIAEKIKEYGIEKSLVGGSLDESIVTVDYNPNVVDTPRELLRLIGL